MEKVNSQKRKILTASVVSALAFLADVYIMVNDSQNYPALGIMSLLFVLGIFLAVSGKIKLRDLDHQHNEESYGNMVMAEKACYLLERKKFREMDGKMNALDEKINPLAKAGEVNHQKISALLNHLMQDQKKVAKLTVSRNKENAMAIMNSNDKVIEKMIEMQESVNSFAEKMQDVTLQDKLETMESAQRELSENVQNVETSLRQEIQAVLEKLDQISELSKENLSPARISEDAEKENSNPANMFQNAEQVKASTVDTLADTKEATSDSVNFGSDTADSSVQMIGQQNFNTGSMETEMENSSGMMNPEAIAALIAKNSQESDVFPKTAIEDQNQEEILEDTIELQPDTIEPQEDLLTEPDAGNNDGMMNPEEIAELLAQNAREASDDEIVLMNHNDVGENLADIIEPLSEPEPEPLEDITMSLPESLEEKGSIEPLSKPETVTSSQPAAPEAGIQNKIMTPEEIAALIAGNTQESQPDTDESSLNAVSAATEPLPPEFEPEPAAEEAKPPKPDLSNPNKVMSPEDIAALIANL